MISSKYIIPWTVAFFKQSATHKFYTLAILVAVVLSSLGELVRLPWGPGNGLLPNDLWVALIGGVWLVEKTFIKKQWPKTAILAPFATFMLIATLSLFHGSNNLAAHEVVTSAFYLIRFAEYFLLFFIAYGVAQKEKGALTAGLLGGGVILAVAGLIQLKWFPSFEAFEQLGWDPHIGRLLSTWFDPNFVGGAFAFLSTLTLALLIEQPSLWKKCTLKTGILTACFALFLVALLLTYSRSSYLMLVASLGVLGLLRSRRLLIVGALVTILLLGISPRAQERVTNLYHTGKALFGISAELPDATARLRLNSWRGAWIIIQDHPILGVGYNAYAYAQANYGFIDDLKKHSASGSDSTLLTVWATTGILGLLAYCWLLGTLLWQTFCRRKNPLSLGVFSGTVGLLIHSIIINSLLFTPFLIFYYTAVALALASIPNYSRNRETIS